MAEYIERKDLLELYRMDDPILNENGHVPLPVIRQNIMDIPAADVALVRHGRWIGAPLCGNDNCKCSECGSWHNIHANLRGKIMQKYCPNCGARMDGDGNG